MARALDFSFGKTAFSAELDKVDRSEIYGSVELETLDPSGRECRLLTLSMDGRTLIPYGGTGMGYLTEDGVWRDKSSLRAVGPEGDAVDVRPSNFDFANVLKQRATPEDLLDHEARLIYRLLPKEGGELPAPFLKELDKGTIFRFDFSYRGGVGDDVAFVLRGTDGTVWMLVSSPTEIKFISLEQASGDAEAEAGSDSGSDDIDFDMF